MSQDLKLGDEVMCNIAPYGVVKGKVSGWSVTGKVAKKVYFITLLQPVGLLGISDVFSVAEEYVVREVKA